MQTVQVAKYLFRIRTRSGVVVENLSIFGQCQEDANRKLRQIYNDCEVLDCQFQQPALGRRNGHVNYEDVVDLIATA
jgi:hypothetical protein